MFKLESASSKPRASETYGMGTQQIQVGDVLIPLWSPDLRPDRHSGYPSREGIDQEGIAIHVSTMLAVRRIEELSPQHSTSILDNRGQAEMGRIIGSAVCVLVERDWNHDCGLSGETNSEDCTNTAQQYSMRLL